MSACQHLLHLTYLTGLQEMSRESCFRVKALLHKFFVQARAGR